MTYCFGGFARRISARNQSIPAASIFAHRSGVSRTVRCTKCSSGGFGGLPRGRFGSSMPLTVAPIYEDSNNPCNPYLSDYNKYINTGADNMTNTKFAGYIGNLHLTIRVTPFFNSAAEVKGDYEFIRQCGNWQEHQRWNQERVGNYAQCPVQE